jgi:membrane protease YdiL (CAAX protease family)
LTSENNWKVFLGPFLLLILIYFVWLVRYPMWHLSDFIEPVFLMLISSYSAVLLFSIFFLKKDAKKPLSQVFKIHGYATPLIGIGFSFLFQVIWFSVYLAIGGKLEFSSFPSLKAYESYAFYSLLSAFALYLIFAVFGAFAEEVAFRSYVQSRVASKYSDVISIFIASLFFSLQHVHISTLSWIQKFFQTQFIYVFCFSIFVGYLFIKSGEDLWSVFAFHASMNVFNVSLPVDIISASLTASNAATIITFILMILLLKLLFRKGNH